MENLKNKKVLVFGLGASGISAYELLKNKKAKVFTFDDVRFPNKTVGCDLKDLDFAIVSPGISNKNLLIKQLEKSKIKMLSEIEFASNFDLGQIIAITGTNGKTTTVSLLGQILKENFGKKKVFVAGNIGTPYSLMVEKTNSKTLSLLEVSSFQLERIDNFKPHISAILNLAPDHLDRYDSFEDYVKAKYNIFKNQDENDFLVLNYNDEFCRQAENIAKAKIIYFSISDEKENENFVGCYINGNKVFFKQNAIIEEMFKLEKIQLVGEKNLENILACACISKILNLKQIEKVIQNFKPLPNRLELVGQKHNVEFINDSKATNVASAIADISAVTGDKVLILGGSDKGECFDDLATALNSSVLHLFVAGQTSEKIIKSLIKNNIKNFTHCTNFENAVLEAYSFSKSLNNKIKLMLVPACASFDEFDNYVMRGKKFKKLIGKLK